MNTVNDNINLFLNQNLSITHWARQYDRFTNPEARVLKLKWVSWVFCTLV